MTTAEQFLDPDAPDDKPERKRSLPGLDPAVVEAAQQFLRQDDDDYVNVSGQPKARYEWHGKQKRGYACADPRTGEIRRYKTSGKPKGWTRATTFNKAATDQNSLSDWGKRNVLIGAALRPDLVEQAQGLTHDDKGYLGSLIAQLEEAAGAKVSADWGTVVHEITELIDGGALHQNDIPSYFLGPVRLYLAALEEHGLRPVPGLIERTTFCDLFDGVAGTFDRVYLHEPSGQYVIGDLKTGKTLQYGMDEIETQLWLYAYGINRYGVYDWNTDEWETPWENDETDPEERRKLTVSEDIGVVIHLPAQGPEQGTCKVVKADLQRGRRHAEVCHQVRVQRSSKPKPVPFTGEDLVLAEPHWDQVFKRVQNKPEATNAWKAAKADGIIGLELNRLVRLAQDRLKELGVSS